MEILTQVLLAVRPLRDYDMVDPVSGMLRIASIRAYNIQQVISVMRSKLKTVEILKIAEKPPLDPNGVFGQKLDIYA